MVYHINLENGNVYLCRAEIRECIYAENGGKHYNSKEEALENAEELMKDRYPLSNRPYSKLKRQLFDSFEEAQKNYFVYGARSSKKIEPIHKSIATHLIEKGLKVSAKGVGDNKEIKVAGKLYDKDCDITIFDQDDLPSSVIEVKFITTNYKQNANNYFENLMGATSNLRRNNINVSQFVVIPSNIPYLDKSGSVKRIETITDKDVDKYRKLMLEPEDNSTPNNLFFVMVDMWNGIEIGSPVGSFNPSKIKETSLDTEKFSKENRDFILNYGNYNKFISKFAAQN